MTRTSAAMTSWPHWTAQAASSQCCRPEARTLSPLQDTPCPNKTRPPKDETPALVCNAPTSKTCRWNAQRSGHLRSEEHTSKLQSLMRISYAVLCLKKNQLQENRTTY